MTLKKLLEEVLPELIVAVVIAFAAATYQFVEMRSEVGALRRDVDNIQTMVSALVSRQTFYKGVEEATEIQRLAKSLEKRPPLSGLEAAQ